ALAGRCVPGCRGAAGPVAAFRDRGRQSRLPRRPAGRRAGVRRDRRARRRRGRRVASEPGRGRCARRRSGRRDDGGAGGMTTTTYHAVRVTYDSARDFDETRARFDELVPLLDPAVTIDLVVRGASWADVERAVDTRTGPLGLVAIARIDQGALLTLSGHPLDATLYLVGNPLIARRLIELDSAAALYAPFRVVVFRDDAGVHI